MRACARSPIGYRVPRSFEALSAGRGRIDGLFFRFGGGGGHSCLRGLDFNEQYVLPVEWFGSSVLFGRQLLFLQSTALFQHNTF